MTESDKPGEGASPYRLPSWIDHAIERSKSDEPSASPDDPDLEAREAEEEFADEAGSASSGETQGEVSETAETREYPLPSLHTNAQPARTPEDSDTREFVPSFLAPGESPEAEAADVEASAAPAGQAAIDVEDVAVAETASSAAEEERARQQRAALPWMIAALLLTAAALVLAYLIWLRPTS